MAAKSTSSNSSLFRHFRKYLWVWTGLFCLVVLQVIQAFTGEAHITSVYTEGIYPYLKKALQFVFGRWPIAPFYFIILVVFFVLIIIVRVWIKKEYVRGIYTLIGLLAWLYVLFYLFWGLNYGGLAIKHRLQLSSVAVDSIELITEINWVTEQLNTLRGDAHLYLSAEEDYSSLHGDIVTAMESTLSGWDIPVLLKPRIRMLKPRGIILRISTAGFYWPYTGEGHIDAGLHPIQWASTAAHEMGHVYGFTDEGECNFIAIAASIQSENKMIRYSGLMSYYRYLMASLRRLYPGSMAAVKASLSKTVAADLDEIHLYLNRYPDIFPGIRNYLYDLYLRKNGVRSGIQSYSEVVGLMMAYRRSR